MVGNFHTATPLCPSMGAVGTGSGVGALETTFQWAGAVTVNVNVAFRSGCSNVV